MLTPRPPALQVRYFITDHLGSVRLVADAAGNVLERNDFLPFGEKCQNDGLVSAENAYLYGGKELQTFFGIDWYDSGARFQTTHGTFSSLDPKAESYYPISPYAYCAGDPVNYVDFKGDVRQLVINRKKKTIVVKAKYYYTIGATERVITAI